MQEALHDGSQQSTFSEVPCQATLKEKKKNKKKDEESENRV